MTNTDLSNCITLGMDGPTKQGRRRDNDRQAVIRWHLAETSREEARHLSLADESVPGGKERTPLQHPTQSKESGVAAAGWGSGRQ